MLHLQMKLLSDAAFGAGDGIAGWIDTDVEHDQHGFPLVRGRTLKGLLVEECANILWSLQNLSNGLTAQDVQAYQAAAHFLFGVPGSREADRARLRPGPAQFPSALRAAIATDIQDKKLTPDMVLESLTALRRQSAVDDTTGAPDHGSLRTLRVVLRDTVLTAELAFETEPNGDAKALLAACVLSLRRGGLGRNRGRGRLQCSLWDAASQREVTELYLGSFPARGGNA